MKKRPTTKRTGSVSNFGAKGYTEGATVKLFTVYNNLRPKNTKKK